MWAIKPDFIGIVSNTILPLFAFTLSRAGLNFLPALKYRIAD